MPKLTPAQERAINEQSKTLLVSAAAGSGKTFTLVERVLRSVTRKENPISLDRLLVVTFTKETAGDLKQRISAAISDAIAKDGASEHLANQIALLPSAKFSTIDSFYLSLVRSNYIALGLSPSFRMADAGEATLIERAVMEELINRCYDDESSTVCGGPRAFASLVDTLVGGKNDSRLGDTMLSLYQTLSSYPRGAAAMKDTADDLLKYAEVDFFSCPYGERIKTHVKEVFTHYKDAYKNAIDMMSCDEKLAKSYCITYADDFSQILKVTSSIESGYTALRDEIEKITFSKMKSYSGEKTPEASFFQKMRNEFKSCVADVKSKYLFADEQVIKENILISAKVCYALGNFLCEYERRLEAEKKRKNVCTFSDLSRYSLRLLVDEDGNDTPFADEQKKLYDAIYIDEYQDVNAVQNRIFEAISTGTNRFMVGDIKQSIYAFRGAESAIFSALRFEYPNIEEAKTSDCAAIFMSQNFRCNEEIIDFTNHICDKLMPLISPSMHYTADDSLVFGKKRESDEKHPVNVAIIANPKKDSPYYGIDAEAEYVADEIAKLLDGEKKDNGTEITPGDIAIILRSPRTHGDAFSNALRSRNIPVFAETEENLLSQNEVEIVRCFIDVIDNPLRDVSLAGALLSPLVGIDCSFLASIRAKKTDFRLITTIREYTGDKEKDKLSAFLSRLYNFRKMARYMSAGELIDAVYADMAIPSVLGGKSKQKRANLEKFRQTAYSFSSSVGSNLSAFLRYLKNVEESSTALTAEKVNEDTNDAVHIISIHKSKGLEFPVVFFSRANSYYRTTDQSASPLYKNSIGFGMRLRDKSGFCTYDTMLRKSVALAKDRADKEEELRLLYVALTRARERMYVTATDSSPDATLEIANIEGKFISPYLAISKNSHLKLILLALCGEKTEFVKYSALHYVPTLSDENTVEHTACEDCTADEETVELLNARFSYSYPNSARTKIPAKLSISRLYPDILDDAVLGTSIDERPLPSVAEAPRFIKSEENLAAKKGTATHLFMQFFDFENAFQNGAEAELARLKDNRFITEEDASLVNLDEVKNFLSSPLFVRMRAATKIFREQRFNMLLPAEDFAVDKELKAALCGEEVLVQGVIDCFFYDSDGEIVLVDYKTDRLPKDRATAIEKLTSVHSRQLSYYARAIEQICGKAPKERIIFSLSLGEAIVL